MSTPHSLHQSVQSVLEHYFATLDGEIPSNLHAIMTQEMERGLLDFVMRRTGHNQSMSARWLGINRNTLNKKTETIRLDRKRMKTLGSICFQATSF